MPPVQYFVNRHIRYSVSPYCLEISPSTQSPATATMIGLNSILLFSIALLECVAGHPAGTTGSRPQPKPLDGIVLPCTRSPQTSHFSNYQLNNRNQYSPVRKNDGLILVKSPANIGGMATVTLESYLVDAPIGYGIKEVQYKIMIANYDKVPHSAQLAWSANKDSRVPDYIFTVTAEVGQSKEGCLYLPMNSLSKYVTWSAF